MTQEIERPFCNRSQAKSAFEPRAALSHWGSDAI
jgi:hypothetical protein